MERRRFIRVLGGGIVSAATLSILPSCSSELPAEALLAWEGPGKHPSIGSDPRQWLIAHAILAPHSHNLQSWLVDLNEANHITLYCDLSRLLPETDPNFRQMMVSQGTFLELLDIAAREIGLRTDIQLFPKGEFATTKLDSRPTARISLIADSNIKPDPLFQQIFKRRTNRNIYQNENPAITAMASIKENCSAEGIFSGFVDSTNSILLNQHRQIAMDAWRIELETPRTILESYQYLRIGPTEITEHRDGLSLNTPMIRFATALGLFDRSKPPAAGDSNINSQIKDFNNKLSTTPAFFWLSSKGNSRSIQVQAGRSYVRAQLAATAHNLFMHPLSQALQEYPEMAIPYAEIHKIVGVDVATTTIQMWCRLGKAEAISPSPRRGYKAHLLAK